MPARAQLRHDLRRPRRADSETNATSAAAAEPVGVERLELQRHAVARIEVVEPAAGLAARGDRLQRDVRMAATAMRGRQRAGEPGGADDARPRAARRHCTRG